MKDHRYLVASQVLHLFLGIGGHIDSVIDDTTRDYYDADTIYQRVTSKVQPGSIVLFHNAALHTPEALPRILSYLINEGYTVVPISQLILTGDYTIDHTGRQFPAEKAEQAE